MYVNFIEIKDISIHSLIINNILLIEIKLQQFNLYTSFIKNFR